MLQECRPSKPKNINLTISTFPRFRDYFRTLNIFLLLKANYLEFKF